jgi:hypothetical protein
MPIKVTELLQANFVMVGIDLLQSDKELKSFADSIDTDIVVEKLVGLHSTAPNGRRLAINRDRVFLELFPDRFSIRQEYPTPVSGFSTLSRLAGLAIEMSAATDPTLVQAHGYNVELLYDPGPLLASPYIGSRIFSDFQRNPGWKTIGGQAGLKFRDTDGTIWNVVIEPRFKQDSAENVFFSLNLHRDEQHIPDTQQIQHSLERTLSEAETFINVVDGS